MSFDDSDIKSEKDPSLPEGTFVDEWGEMSGDPLLLYGAQSEGIMPNAKSGPGALRTFGEHKGSGLNFIIELLAGALTGSGVPTEPVDPTNRKVWNGMLSIFLLPDFLLKNIIVFNLCVILFQVIIFKFDSGCLIFDI